MSALPVPARLPVPILHICISICMYYIPWTLDVCIREPEVGRSPAGKSSNSTSRSDRASATREWSYCPEVLDVVRNDAVRRAVPPPPLVSRSSAEPLASAWREPLRWLSCLALWPILAPETHPPYDPIRWSSRIDLQRGIDDRPLLLKAVSSYRD